MGEVQNFLHVQQHLPPPPHQVHRIPACNEHHRVGNSLEIAVLGCTCLLACSSRSNPDQLTICQSTHASPKATSQLPQRLHVLQRHHQQLRLQQLLVHHAWPHLRRSRLLRPLMARAQESPLHSVGLEAGCHCVDGLQLVSCLAITVVVGSRGVHIYGVSFDQENVIRQNWDKPPSVCKEEALVVFC